jgi:Domain of unknown function (DUF4372)
MEFESAVRQHNAERHARGFSSWGQFIAMLFCQLGHAKSLREICGLAASEGKLRHLGVPTAPARSTIHSPTQPCKKHVKNSTRGARFMPQRKPYSPPRATKQEFGSDYLKWMASLESDSQEQPLSPQRKVEPDHKAVVNSDRRFVELSDGFCKLVGYTREELLSMRYDELTARNTNDIPIILA